MFENVSNYVKDSHFLTIKFINYKNSELYLSYFNFKAKFLMQYVSRYIYLNFLVFIISNIYIYIYIYTYIHTYLYVKCTI